MGSHGHGVHRQQRRSPWIENSRPLDVRSQRIRGFVRIGIFSPSQIRLIFYGLSVPQLWIHVLGGRHAPSCPHPSVSNLSTEIKGRHHTCSKNVKAVCRHISATPSLQVRPSAHMQSLLKTDQVQVEKEHKTSLEKTSAGVGSAGKESHVFILTKLTLPCSSLWLSQTW